MKQSELHWIALSPNVFVDYTEGKILLYNTRNYKCITSTDTRLINLIREFYRPENLGVLSLDEFEKMTSNDVRVANNMNMFVSVKNSTKPLNFLPILNLQHDLTKNMSGGLKEIKGKLSLLSSLFIQINYGYADSKVSFYRNLTSKQYATPCFSEEKTTLRVDFVEQILKEACLSSIHNVHIIIGSPMINIMEYIRIFERYNFQYYLHIYSDIVYEFLSHISDYSSVSKINFVVFCDRYSNPNIAQRLIKESKDCGNFEFINLIDEVDRLLSCSSSAMKMLPVWTENNFDFFLKEVFIGIEDIEASELTLSDLFCNQKLNRNFFGILQINPDETIAAFLDGKNTRYSGTNILNQAVVSELINNTRWRVTRNMTSCRTCPYKYLCPPVTALELNFKLDKICKL
ncbi:hypothetical protein PRLR6014_05250 [Prevotella lacticifex]|uniref:hypothetical protein n=1 Tax=Prevotella lacticifex TaxID=2854755 RepID=UPI001CC401F9|nr:hypothetical protein [Prevotella lacticifex]GJG64049.1 hypothetical protein PRLR6014_05250 [Prevotella lacticifex]